MLTSDASAGRVDDDRPGARPGGRRLGALTGGVGALSGAAPARGARTRRDTSHCRTPFWGRKMISHNQYSLLNLITLFESAYCRIYRQTVIFIKYKNKLLEFLQLYPISYITLLVMNKKRSMLDCLLN